MNVSEMFRHTEPSSVNRRESEARQKVEQVKRELAQAELALLEVQFDSLNSEREKLVKMKEERERIRGWFNDRKADLEAVNKRLESDLKKANEARLEYNAATRKHRAAQREVESTRSMLIDAHWNLEDLQRRFNLKTEAIRDKQTELDKISCDLEAKKAQLNAQPT